MNRRAWIGAFCCLFTLAVALCGCRQMPQDDILPSEEPPVASPQTAAPSPSAAPLPSATPEPDPTEGNSEEAPDDTESGAWSGEPSDTPEAAVSSALSGLNNSEGIISCEILTVEYDAELTALNIQSLVGSELAERNGFTDAYLESHFAVVIATYEVAYDDAIPHMNIDGIYKCIFSLTQDESTGLWTIWDFSTPYLLNE